MSINPKKTKLVDKDIQNENICDLKNSFGLLEGTYWSNKYKIPTVLIETVYLSNPEDKKWIQKPSNQKLIMKAVVSGLIKYYKTN